MKNREKYKDKIIAIALTGDNWGIEKSTGIPKPCNEIRGSECSFGNESPYECYRNKAEWLDTECDRLDWDKVPVDTLVEYYEDGLWKKAYFAGTFKGYPYIFTFGRTSETSLSDLFFPVGRKLIDKDRLRLANKE